jgi:hypothetical protein
MKKTFLVLALVALASVAASAKNYNIAFTGFCDAMEVSTTGNSPALIFTGGVHDYSACFGTSSLNTYIGGFHHSFYKSIDPNGGSTILDLVDPSLGYLYGLPYPLEYLVNVSGGCAWSNYVDVTGSGHVLNNAGSCSFFTGALKASGSTKSTAKIAGK